MSKTKLPPDVIEARAEAARNAERTRRTLREYARKLHHIADRLWALRREAGTAPAKHHPVLFEEMYSLMSRRRVVASAIEAFTRAASGMVEQAALDRLFKVELLARLRETENALDEARNAATACRKLAPSWFPEKLLEDVGLPDLRTVRYEVPA